MPMEAYAVKLRIERAVRTSDGAGGDVETWQPLATGILAQKHLKQTGDVSFRRIENTRGLQASGPGTVTNQTHLFIVYAPFPKLTFQGQATKLAPKDRLVEEACDSVIADPGAIYSVIYPRQYEQTLQVDCEHLT